jgi:hypothetical protein
MALPGFSAENSLRPNVQTYRVASYYGVAGADYLIPQQFGDIDVADIEDVEAAEDDMAADIEDIAEETGEDALAEEEM